LDRRLAAINVNWDGQGPDLMSPAELAAFTAEAAAFHQESGNLLLAVGHNSASERGRRAAGAN
jgi:hypothetical protein